MEGLDKRLKVGTEVMNTDQVLSEKIHATVEPMRRIFLVVAVCLLLVGMSVVVWSEWELSRLEYWSRQCESRRAFGGLTSEIEAVVSNCLRWNVEYRWWFSMFGRLVGIVGSSIGVGILLLLVFFRLRIPISRTPA